MVVIVLSTLMFLTASMAMTSSASSREANARADDTAAFFLAEAGLADAVTALEAGATGTIGTALTPVALGDGVYWTTATPTAGGQNRVVVTALVRSGRASIDVVLRATQDPLFPRVLTSADTLTLNADVLVDSFDSKLGTYLSQVLNVLGLSKYANDRGDVSSNKNIELNAGAVVFGDAVPGPGESITYGTGALVTGSTAPATEKFAFPAIEVPTIPSAGSYSLGTGASDSLPAGKYAFKAFELQKTSVLKIQGPAEIVVGDFTAYNDARILIDATSGPVTFYVEGAYVHGKGFEADAVAGSPAAVAFMITGANDVVFPSSTKIRGAYYVPNANVMFTSGNEMWGSIAAQKVEMSSTMNFHYDESLAEYWQADTGGDSSSPVVAWVPTSVQPSNLASDRRDPLSTLGIAAADTTLPEAGWVW